MVLRHFNIFQVNKVGGINMQDNDNNVDSSENEVDKPVKRPDPDEVEKDRDLEGKNKKVEPPKPRIVELGENYNSQKESEEDEIEKE